MHVPRSERTGARAFLSAPPLTAATASVARQEGILRGSVRRRLVPAEVDEGSVPVSRAKNRPRSSRSRSRPSDCGMTTRSLRRASNSSRGSSPPQPLILVLIDETRTEDYAVESIHDVLHQQVAFVLEVFAQKIVGSHGTPHTYPSSSDTVANHGL